MSRLIYEGMWIAFDHAYTLLRALAYAPVWEATVVWSRLNKLISENLVTLSDCCQSLQTNKRNGSSDSKLCKK